MNAKYCTLLASRRIYWNCIAMLILLSYKCRNKSNIFRFVVGLGVGGTIAVCGRYAYEMTSRDTRGLLCCSIQLPVGLGILFSYVVGKYVTWNALAAINASLLIPYWFFIHTTPESPYFLVGRGKEYSASKSVEWLHGRNVSIVDEELLQIKQVRKKYKRYNALKRNVIFYQHASTILF